MKPSTKLGLRLFLLGLVFILTLLGAVVVMARLGCFPPPDTIEVYIGVHPRPTTTALKAAQAVSLTRLAQEIRKHPRITIFIIKRDAKWFAFDEGDSDKTYYDRKAHWLYDSDDYDDETESWHNVNDTAILNVAGTTRDFKDLARYGCEDTLPP